MALSDRLMQNLRVALPGALDGMINLHLWNVVHNFCKETHVWQQDVPIDLVEGVTVYPAVEYTPIDTYILALIEAKHDTYDVTGAYFDSDELVLDERHPPTAADAATPLTVRFALAPALDTGGDVENMIPLDMWFTYYETFTHGTLALMMMQSAKPYSNPAMAAYHYKAYRSRIATNRWRGKTNNVPGAQLWRFPTHTR